MDLEKKIRAEYSTEELKSLAVWIESTVGPAGLKGATIAYSDLGAFGASLQNGIVLCKFLNAIRPGTVKKIIEDAKMPLLLRFA